MGEIKKLLDDENTSDLLDFLKRKNPKNQYGQFIDELKTNPSLLHFFEFLSQNKQGLNYRPILDKIDGEEEDEPSPKSQLDRLLTSLSGDPSVRSIKERLARIKNPTFVQ